MPKIRNYQHSKVAVIGGGDSALDAAVMAVERNGLVTQIIREDVPVGKSDTLSRLKEDNVTVFTGCEITEASFANDRFHLRLSNGKNLECEYIIIQIGFLSSRHIFENLNLKLKADGSVAVDSYFETSRSGIFAAGDVHGDIKLITVAWAEGIQAAIYAFKEITSPYWLNERRLKDQRITLIGEKIASAASHRHEPE